MKLSLLLYFTFATLLSMQLVSCGGADERKVKYLSKGKVYLQQNNLDKARLEFKNALQIDPKYADGYYYMASINEKTKSYKNALAGYNKAIDLKPDHVKAMIGIGRVYLMAGMTSKAIEYAGKALDISIDNPDALVVRAGANFRNNNIDKALSDVRSVLDIDPDNISGLALLSRIYIHIKQPNKSNDLLVSALNRFPGNINIQTLLTQLYVENKQYEKAISIMLEIIKTYPKHLLYRDQLSGFYIKTNDLDKSEDTLRLAIKDFPDDIQPKLMLIKFMLDNHDVSSAQSEVSGFIALDVDNQQLKLISAELHQQDNNIKSAETIYREIIRQYTDEVTVVKARYALAALLINDSRIDDGVDLLDSLLIDYPSHYAGLMLRGTLALEHNDVHVAISDFRAILKDQPSLTNVIKLLAQSYIEDGKFNLAEESLKQAILISPTDLSALFTLAQVYHQQKNYNDAIKYLDDVLFVAPTHLESKQLKLKIYLIQKNYLQAHLIADNLLKTYPEISLGYFYKGLVLQAQKKYVESMGLFDKALIISPKSIEPLSSYVRSALALSNHDKAKTKLYAILKKEPNHVVARNMLGEVFLHKKQYKQAIDVFNMNISINKKWWISYRNLASAEILSNNIDAAVKTYRHGIEFSINKDQLSFKLASLLKKQNKFEEAIALYEEIIQSGVNVDAAVNNLALLLIDDFDDQLSKDRALSLVHTFQGTKNAIYLDTTGWVYYKRGEFDRALYALLQADRYAPNQVLIQYHLGSVYYSKGDMFKAKEFLENVSKSKLDFNGKTDAKRMLLTITNYSVNNSV